MTQPINLHQAFDYGCVLFYGQRITSMLPFESGGKNLRRCCTIPMRPQVTKPSKYIIEIIRDEINFFYADPEGTATNRRPAISTYFNSSAVIFKRRARPISTFFWIFATPVWSTRDWIYSSIVHTPSIPLPLSDASNLWLISTGKLKHWMPKVDCCYAAAIFSSNFLVSIFT